MIRLPHTIETFSGVEFSYHDPYVNLDDVAHGLSQVCRFAAQTQRFYSVAEHSVLVSRLVARSAPELALGALWHDAHEAYMGDCPTPLKDIIGKEYHALARIIDRDVCGYLGLGEDFPLKHPLIKHADETAMVFEASVLMPGPGWDFTRQMDHRECHRVIHGWNLGTVSRFAEDLFRYEHKKLTDDH